MQSNTPSAGRKYEELYTTNPDWFENLVLLAAVRCADLWTMFNRTLCWNTTFTSESNDFGTKTRYNVFRALRRFKQAQINSGSGGMSCQMSVSSLRGYLQQMLKEDASTMFDTEIEPTCEYYTSLIAETQSDVELGILVKQPYKEWILIRRLEAAQEEAQYTDIKGTELIRLLHSVQDDLRSRLGFEEEDTLKDFVQELERQDVVTERLPFSAAMDPMNKALGGGLGRKEHIIIVGPTGAGKTVFACQVAADLACQGRKVCYVTTEQPANELIPRVVSNLSASTQHPIPFSIIKDGIELEKLSDEQKTVLNNFKTQLKDNLGIEEWLGSGLTASDLESSVTKFVKRYGKLDVLILDWIGGALVNGVDPKLKRDYYLDAAQKMKDLAYTYNIATISMAQAVADTQKTKHISDKHIAECKTMHREAVAGFGISALADVSPDSETTYKDNQYLYAFKSRKAPGLIIDMQRQFDYQRFKLFASKQQ